VFVSFGIVGLLTTIINIEIYKVSYMPVYRVHMDQVKKGAAIERKEHPTMSPAIAARTARQHLQHHPMYYKMEPQFEKMLDAREKNIKPIRPRPTPHPQQEDPFF
jgi:hypothetical protein